MKYTLYEIHMTKPLPKDDRYPDTVGRRGYTVRVAVNDTIPINQVESAISAALEHTFGSKYKALTEGGTIESITLLHRDIIMPRESMK